MTLVISSTFLFARPKVPSRFLASLRARLSLLLRRSSITRRSYGARLQIRISQPILARNVESFLCVPGHLPHDFTDECSALAEMAFHARDSRLGLAGCDFLCIRNEILVSLVEGPVGNRGNIRGQS